MNVEIGAEAAQFPEKEYMNRIAVAVQSKDNCLVLHATLYLGDILILDNQSLSNIQYEHKKQQKKLV